MWNYTFFKNSIWYSLLATVTVCPLADDGRDRESSGALTPLIHLPTRETPLHQEKPHEMSSDHVFLLSPHYQLHFTIIFF